MNQTIIEIDKTQFIQNLLVIRGLSKNSKICLPVKANAYGHGLSGIAKIAQPYVDYLAVACLNEGKELRDVGIIKPILVFGAFDVEQIDGLIENNLEITISSMFKAKNLVEYCLKYGARAKVHIKIDVGMHRIGVRPNSSYELIDYILSYQCIDLVGIYSHFSSSESNDLLITQDEFNRFIPVVEYAKNKNPDIICHIANSGALCNHPYSYLDMVRPGILSYGYLPNPEMKIYNSEIHNIAPIFTLKSRVSYFKVLDKHMGISYNHKYHTKDQTRVVTIPIGYGDGFRRELSNRGHVLIRGKKYQISGAICMDMLMVDIGPNDSAYIGDEVVLIGKQGSIEILLEDVANLCNTISYEILCSFNSRIPRFYVD